MNGPPPGRSAWAVPLLLFAAVLLAAGLAFNLANLDTGGEAVPDVPDAGGTPPNSRSLIGLLPLLQAAVALVGLLLLAGMVYLLLHRRAERHPALRRTRRSNALGILLSILGLVPILALWRRAEPVEGTGSSQDGTGTAIPGIVPADLPVVAGIPLGVFLAASILIGFLVVAYLFRPPSRGWVSTREGSLPDPPRAEASVAVGTAIEELELGADVRGTILQCFWRFCELLGARGVTGQEVLTPREIEGLAIHVLLVSRRDAEDLTSLFEEARYSVHPLGEGDRDRARQSFERIREGLEA